MTITTICHSSRFGQTALQDQIRACTVVLFWAAKPSIDMHLGLLFSRPSSMMSMHSLSVKRRMSYGNASTSRTFSVIAWVTFGFVADGLVDLKTPIVPRAFGFRQRTATCNSCGVTKPQAGIDCSSARSRETRQNSRCEN